MFLSLERAFVACTVASGELDFEPAGEINRGVSENPGSRIGLSFTFPVPVRDHYQLKLSGSLVRHYLWLQVTSCGAHDARRNLNWFTEGFDAADLKDAKALLEELSV